MVNVAALEELLGGLEKFGVRDATLVSRSGMYIAGRVPAGAHQETFVAMSAILLGAAETAASELKDECRDVHVELNGSRLYIRSAGPKALLVMRTDHNTDISGYAEELKRTAKQLGDLL